MRAGGLLCTRVPATLVRVWPTRTAFPAISFYGKIHGVRPPLTRTRRVGRLGGERVGTASPDPLLAVPSVNCGETCSWCIQFAVNRIPGITLLLYCCSALCALECIGFMVCQESPPLHPAVFGTEISLDKKRPCAACCCMIVSVCRMFVRRFVIHSTWDIERRNLCHSIVRVHLFDCISCITLDSDSGPWTI